MSEIEVMQGFSPNLLFSTVLLPETENLTADWWYLGRDHGQHISFYTVASLQVIANRFKLHLATNNIDTHLLSKKPISPRLLRFFTLDTVSSRAARWLLRRRMRRQSLLLDDFRAVSGYDF
jgi:hypothetical protein